MLNSANRQMVISGKEIINYKDISKNKLISSIVTVNVTQNDPREEQESQLNDVLAIKEFLFNLDERSSLCLPRYSNWLSILLND